MNNNYYNIDDIIADSQKLPCSFEITVPGLGYLQGNIGQDMKEGTNLELPLWLAELLAVSSISPDSQKSFISLNQPNIFSSKVINALKSDPLNVDLHNQSTVFFWVIERWLSLFGDKELGQVAEETIRTRASEIFDFAHTHKGLSGENSDFLFKLDEFEKQLFKVAYESTKEMRNWQSS